MYRAICPLAVIPVRSKPDETSEMISQLLFGETMRVVKRKRAWAKIICDHDGYEGWIDIKHQQEVKEDFNNQGFVAYEIAQPVMNGEHFMTLLMGSSLPQFDGMSFRMLQKEQYNYTGQVIDVSALEPSTEMIAKVARRYLYTPYLWGGRSPFGIDCSGFVQMVYKFLGVSLKRDASLQIDHGETVDFIHEAQAGDLAFFQNEEGRIHHVGMMLNAHEIIHSSGQVKIDSIDQQGIYSKSKRRYTHHLRVIKRIL